MDDCPDLLAGCSSLRRLTLTTASLQVMRSLPTSLTELNLSLQLPTDGRMPMAKYLSIVVDAAAPLSRWEGRCHFPLQHTAWRTTAAALSPCMALLHFHTFSYAHDWRCCSWSSA